MRGEARACAKETLGWDRGGGGLAAERTRVDRKFEVINARDATSALYWLDFDGNEAHYVDLPPGMTTMMSTFGSHVWVSRDMATNAAVAENNYLDRFFTRVNKVFLDERAASNETERLTQENDDLKRILTDYLNGTTVNETGTCCISQIPTLFAHTRLTRFGYKNSSRRSKQPPVRGERPRFDRAEKPPRRGDEGD